MNLFSFVLFAFLSIQVNGFVSRTQSSCPHLKVPFGRVKYRQRGRFAKIQCNIGFSIAGDTYNQCKGSRWERQFPKCVRATCKTARPPTNGFIYPTHMGAVLHFFCKGDYQLRGANTSYCDGHQWDNPLPTCLPTNTTPPTSCDFEQADLCGWSHDLNHDFDWRRQNYNTPSGAIGTGPSFDHTKGIGKAGYYMYIESSPRIHNDTARLISPVYDKTTNNMCFEFWYHMYGVGIGDLRVYLKKVSEEWNVRAETALFDKHGNQGDKWYKSILFLGPIDEDFQIIMEGLRGKTYLSDIAIDDVRIITNCTPEEISTTTDTPSSSETPPIIDSCQNRCSEIFNHTLRNYTCDCDESCADRERCCPDYLDFCFGGGTTDAYEEITSTIETTIQETTPTRSKTTPTTPTTPTTTPTTQVTTPPSTQPSTTMRATPRTRPSHIIYPTPNDDDKTNDLSNGIDDFAEPFYHDYDNNKEIVTNEKIVITAQPVGSNPMRTGIFVVGVVIGVLVCLVGVAFVARRYRKFDCRHGMNYRSNGDSQSDVRFISNEEVINYSLGYNSSDDL